MQDSADGTIGKAIAVLDHVAMADRPLRLADIVPSFHYPKATLHRLLQSLTRQGMLMRDASGGYSAGLRLLRLAHSAWARCDLAAVSRPHIDSLSAMTGTTIHLAQLDQGQILYLDKRNAARPVDMFSAAGKVGPAYCTGVGKAILAFLPEPALTDALARQSYHRFTDNTLTTQQDLRTDLAEIRTRGHAYDREEHEPGIICCAAPILDAGHRPIGALSITATTRETSLSALKLHLPALKQTAAAIAEQAALWRFPVQGS